MRRFGTTLLAVVPALALGARGASAQELGEVCPEAQAGTGALWGLVSDAESGIGLPGATVVATWESEGDQARAEGQAALDGGYVLCHVPLGLEVSVQPIVAGLGGTVVVTTLTGDFGQVDLSYSLADAGSDDRVWACPDARGDPAGRGRLSRLVRCDSDWGRLEACPLDKVYGEVEAELPVVTSIEVVSASELARLQAEMRRARGREGLGSGPGFRRAVEEMVAAAKRMGANALIDWDRERATLKAKAVTITVDPSTCG